MFQFMSYSANKSVLVLYDSYNYYGDERDAVVSISNLLKHFDKDIYYEKIEDFQGSLNPYDYIFIFKFKEKEISEPLVKSLSKYGGRILWIGKGINQLTESSGHSIQRYGEVNNLTRVVYKDRFYDIGTQRYFEKVLVDANGTVYSYLYDGVEKYPFILKDKNLYYVSRLDLNEPLFYIFADVLYDFFNEPVRQKSRVLIKISNVHPYTDEIALLEVATFLLERRIPFIVSFSPFYKEEGSRFSTSLSENNDLVRVLQFIQENNQGLILQGGSQYYTRTSIKGEDYFEWLNNKDLDLPSEETSVDKWIKELINSALNESGSNQIFPIGFEGSHYALSKEAYEVIGKHFDLYVGTLQTNDWHKTVTVYPWVINDINGLHYYLPDNLGFFSSDPASGLESLKSSLRKMDIVSEFVGGISITPEIELEELEKLVNFLEKQGLEYYDITEVPLEVRGEKVTVISDENQLSGTSDMQEISFSLNSEMNIVIVVVLMILIFVFFLFFKIFRTSKRRTDDGLF